MIYRYYIDQITIEPGAEEPFEFEDARQVKDVLEKRYDPVQRAWVLTVLTELEITP